MRRFIFLFVAVLALRAGDQLKKKEPDLPEAVRNVIELARSGSPEIFADTIARLAESGSIPMGSKRNDLLEEAFAAASRAHESMPWMAVPGLGPDNRAIFRSKASALGLDATSLENRLMKIVTSSDPVKARQLFESVPHPMVETRPCDDPLVPDASGYYEMAAEVAQVGFSPQEKKDERHIQFLQSALAGARSPGELAAFAVGLNSLSLKPAELELLLGALAARMEAIGPDYRSFTLTADKLRGALQQLVSRAREQKIDVGVLGGGVRRFLTQQMSAPRCNQDFGDAGTAVNWFNMEFGSAFPPITPEETKPSQRLGGIKPGNYFDSGEAKHLAEEFQKLRGTPGAATAERSTGDWRNMQEDFLRDWSLWTPSGSEIDAFHQKFTMLRGLLDATPPGDGRELVIAQLITYLQSTQVENEYPEEWLFQVKSLVDSAGPDKPKLMQDFRASGDAGLVLFATMRP